MLAHVCPTVCMIQVLSWINREYEGGPCTLTLCSLMERRLFRPMFHLWHCHGIKIITLQIKIMATMSLEGVFTSSALRQDSTIKTPHSGIGSGLQWWSCCGCDNEQETSPSTRLVHSSGHTLALLSERFNMQTSSSGGNRELGKEEGLSSRTSTRFDCLPKWDGIQTRGSGSPTFDT